MRLSTFALWSTALVISASMATGQEQRLPEFYEAHEIGFVDLNSPQDLDGWLSTIPASSPMFSRVARNDGRDEDTATVSRPGMRNPMDGRASAPAAGVSRGAPTARPPGQVTTQPNVPVTRTRGGDNSAVPTSGRRPTPPAVERERANTATPPTTETTTTPVATETFRPPRIRLTACDPLLHFYADSAVTVNVHAGFKNGIPVAWWPRGVAMGEHIEFRDLRVDPRLDPVTSGSVDTRAWPGLKPLSLMRDAMATPVKLGNKVEGGISYEGMVEFGPDVTVRRATAGVYEVRNDSKHELLDAILVPFGETQNGVALGTLKPGQVVHVEMKDAKLQPLTALMAKGLAATGLFPAEIAGLQELILTPQFRYNPGARLLTRFTEAEWATLFPLKIAPAPKRLVRVGMLRIFDAQLYNAANDRIGNGRPARKAQLTTGHGRR